MAFQKLTSTSRNGTGEAHSVSFKGALSLSLSLSLWEEKFHCWNLDWQERGRKKEEGRHVSVKVTLALRRDSILRFAPIHLSTEIYTSVNQRLVTRYKFFLFPVFYLVESHSIFSFHLKAGRPIISSSEHGTPWEFWDHVTDPVWVDTASGP